MPMCHLYCNIPAAEIKNDIQERFAKCVADVLNKPFESVIVVVVPGVQVFRMGSSDRSCIITISSIAVFDKERNPGYTGPIKEFAMQEFGLERERVALIYQDLERHMVGV